MSWRLKRTKHLSVLAVSLAVVSVTTARADIINVPADFPTIQEAIDAASDGDEVVVAPGIYVEDLNISKKLITVRSSDGPDVTFVRPEVQDPAVRLHDLLPGSLFEGFTLTSKEDFVRTLILINGGEVTVSDCVFSDSPSRGIEIVAYIATIIDCTFQGLSSLGNGPSEYGGAIFISVDASPAISGCTFLSNTSRSGGAIFIGRRANPYINNCTFIDNHALTNGGAIGVADAFQAEPGARPTFNSCLFIGNSADFGGAIYNGGDPIFVNCLIRDNEALFGGGMLNTISSRFPSLVNCTIVQNVAVVGGGVVNDDFTLLTISNSIIRFNQPDQIVDVPLAATTVLYSNVQDGWPGIGNIDADPVFVDPDNDDYHISPTSPCIDAADNTAVPKDSTTDLDGNPRFIEDPKTPDTGLGDCPIVDMGAYEFQEGTADCCPADFDNTGAVDVKDLLFLLGAWGPCPPKGDCPPDFDNSGAVDVKDLLFLLGAWGPCL